MRNDAARPLLLRGLTTWDVVAIGVNGVIGGGIFLAPAAVARMAGSWSLPAYLFAGLLVAMIALCFAEVGGRFGSSGGPFLYAQEAFGPFTGFQVGWFTWIARVTSLASLANGLITYSAWLHPSAGSGLPRVAVLTALLGGLTAINVAGVRWGARTINALTLIKLAPLILFVAAGLPHVAVSRIVPGESPGLAGLSEAMLFLIYVFTGFEVVTFPAEEMVDPRRAVPRAIFTTMGIVAVIYLGVHGVAMGTLEDLSATDTPLATAASQFLGPAAAAVITLGALLSICGTEGGLMLTTPRLLYAMAERGHLPSALSRVSSRFRTPHVAILAQGGIALALAVPGTFESLAKLSAIARIVSYLSTCAALIALRRRGAAPPSFTVPGGPIVPAAAMLLCVWLVASSSLRHLAMGGGALAAGVLLYGLRRATAAAYHRTSDPGD